MKKTKEDWNKWRTIPYLWAGRCKILKIPINLNVYDPGQYINSGQFNENPKWVVFAWLYVGLTTNSKIYMEVQRSKRSKNTIEEENKMRGFTIQISLLITKLQ